MLSTVLTYGQITKVVIERYEEQRANFRNHFGHNLWPERVGRPVFKKTSFARGRRYSLLPALSLDGVIYIQVTEGSYIAAKFYDFVDCLLDYMQPFPIVVH
ncbi:hypothetical protein E1B28_007117 [Marasmius oreades]|uniref:Uncharacterized protein n=1 Tax=Marasmius oreades TaxID=181124 RepID=A0A9P7UVK0_9AGAR|nr:uncharacterized protein E1B28_007117 [Marasmius oreades]KAG7093439.1 hypothetical protein E1B28_007117 [Marasmius oreades]